MRARVILNPSADHGRAGALQDQILAYCREYGEADLVKSEQTGHATELAREAADAGYDLVLAAGGDGTVHEIANGLVHGSRAETALGLIPIGSGNDFAYGMGLMGDMKMAVRRAFSGKSRLNDLARVEDDRGQIELAVNGIGIGFDATVSIQSRMITRIHGFAMYALATLRTIAFYYQTPELEIHFDDERINQQALLLAVGLGPRIGGGFYLTPDAVFDDGLLDSCTVHPVNRPTMIKMLPEVMRGSHITSRHVTMRRNKNIHLTSDIALPIHLDGEIFAFHEDNVRQVTITILPAALPVMIGDE